jgi:hypothetical protein
MVVRPTPTVQAKISVQDSYIAELGRMSSKQLAAHIEDLKARIAELTGGDNQ